MHIHHAGEYTLSKSPTLLKWKTPHDDFVTHCPHQLTSRRCFCWLCHLPSCSQQITDGYATTNDPAMNKCYNEVFIDKIRMLQRIQKLQQTWRNTIGQCSRRMRTMCHAFLLWLERQSSSLLLFVRFSYQFSSVICVFSSENIFLKLFCYIILATSRQNIVRKLDGNFALGCESGMDYP